MLCIVLKDVTLPYAATSRTPRLSLETKQNIGFYVIGFVWIICFNDASASHSRKEQYIDQWLIAHRGHLNYQIFPFSCWYELNMNGCNIIIYLYYYYGHHGGVQVIIRVRYMTHSFTCSTLSAGHYLIQKSNCQMVLSIVI